MHKLVLFDVGHVLVELTGADLLKRFAQAELADEHIHQTWASVPGVLRFETGACDETEFAESVIAFYRLRCSAADFMDHFRNAAERKFDGVDLLLDRLAASYALACLTNTNPLQWPRISNDFGLGAYFSRQYVSFELGMMKPDLAIYQHVLDDTGLQPPEILFVDDNEANCAAARSVGIDTCHVTSFEDAQRQIATRLGIRDITQ